MSVRLQELPDGVQRVTVRTVTTHLGPTSGAVRRQLAAGVQFVLTAVQHDPPAWLLDPQPG